MSLIVWTSRVKIHLHRLLQEKKLAPPSALLVQGGFSYQLFTITSSIHGCVWLEMQCKPTDQHPNSTVHIKTTKTASTENRDSIKTQGSNFKKTFSRFISYTQNYQT